MVYYAKFLMFPNLHPPIFPLQNSLLLKTGLERSQQLRGDRSVSVAIEDCWRWRMMAENLFSKTIIWQWQRFATTNNNHTQISHPKRHRLKTTSKSSTVATANKTLQTNCFTQKTQDSNGRWRFEQTEQRWIGAEASNGVASIGWIDKKGNLFTFWTIHTKLMIA